MSLETLQSVRPVQVLLIPAVDYSSITKSTTFQIFFFNVSNECVFLRLVWCFLIRIMIQCLWECITAHGFRSCNHELSRRKPGSWLHNGHDAWAAVMARCLPDTARWGLLHTFKTMSHAAVCYMKLYRICQIMYKAWIPVVCAHC